MRNFKFPIVLLFLSFVFFMGCSEDSTSSNKVDEHTVLVEYLEGAAGDYINTSAPAIKTASAVRTDMTGGNQYLIDIRSTDAYSAGHVEGAINVAFGDLLTHVEAITTNPDNIVIICYSGQTAAYGTCLLRLLGHDNVYSMKFGMSSWHSDFDVWTPKTSNLYVTDFETTAHAVGGNVAAPVLETGFDAPADILRAKVEELFTAGFGAATIGASTVVPNANDYYVVNYWPEAQYLNPGHIEGAYCYVPKVDLKSTTKLHTLPAGVDDTIVIYCYTGQTSANIAAYLKVLGYNAKTLTYGANSMIYDTMPASKFTSEAIMGYEYITGM